MTRMQIKREINSPRRTVKHKSPARNPELVFIYCPIWEKDEAKRLGCKWDGLKKQWYANARNPNLSTIMEKWGKQKERIYLNIPYHKKDEIKCAGALWDGGKKKWYVEEDHPNLVWILIIADFPSREILRIQSKQKEDIYEIARNRIRNILRKQKDKPKRTNTKLYDFELSPEYGNPESHAEFMDWFFDIKPFLEDELYFDKKEGNKIYLNVPANEKENAIQLGAKYENGKVYIDYSLLHEEKNDGDFGKLEEKYYDPNLNGGKRSWF